MRLGPVVAAALLVTAGAGAWVWLKGSPAPQQEARPSGKRFAKGDGPVPVSVAAVQLATVPVYREGIGNVQALAAVTVRSQVDGRLMSVEFQEGQEVRKGDVLARIDPVQYQAQLDQALAKKAQDEASLANARLDLERAQKLMKLNAGPKKTEDTALAQVRQLEAQIKSDEAAIDNARAVLGYTTITSPLDGRTGLRLVDPGNLIRGDSSGIVSIMQVTPITVVFTLPQRDLPIVSAALGRGAVPVEIMSSDGKAVAATGQLQTIDNQVDQATGTIKLKARFANEDRKLWPGQFVSTRVVVETLTDAKVIPTAAVRRGPSGTFVYAVSPDKKAVVTPVKLALETESQAVVSEGLEAGAGVVTLGFSRLTDGKDVDVVTPGASRPAGEKGRRSRKSGEAGTDKSSRAPGAGSDTGAAGGESGGGTGAAAAEGRSERRGKREGRDGSPRRQEAGVPDGAGAGAGGAKRANP